ncbi:hypothetical protein [Rhodoferax mekongensis]|uniref:Uncharacterized protein n=1 Tax=Rhodoferax mekongensis TaxID=3068341 RepID=A0ABZ0B2C7_9BURK|nr:hypothetical protein [Rhodoferax sp. TBRC 17307]WNO06008.1 hypothetical protein RAN89_06150 [Rhodoferax sp. TBRC 17307]
MSNVHPTFDAIFKSFGIKPEPIEMQTYRAALKNMDWQYEYADDSLAYTKGKLQFNELKRQQQLLDPDARIWNEYAHPEKRITNDHLLQIQQPSAAR